MRTNQEIRKLFIQAGITKKLSQEINYRNRGWIRKFLEYHNGIALDQVELHHGRNSQVDSPRNFKRQQQTREFLDSGTRLLTMTKTKTKD